MRIRQHCSQNVQHQESPGGIYHEAIYMIHRVNNILDRACVIDTMAMTLHDFNSVKDARAFDSIVADRHVMHAEMWPVAQE